MLIVKQIARYRSSLLVLNLFLAAAAIAAEPDMNANFLAAEGKVLEKTSEPTHSSYTQYETRFLPGLNPCPSFTNNPANTAMTECQQQTDPQARPRNELFRSAPSTIVDNDIEPRANLLQIKIDRRIRANK